MDLISIEMYKDYLEKWAKKFCDGNGLQYQGFDKIGVCVGDITHNWEDVLEYLMR